MAFGIDLSALHTRSKNRRQRAAQINQMSSALVSDMLSGEMVPARNGNDYVRFPGKNERLDHEGFVSYLGTDEFEALMRDFHEAAMMDGIGELCV